MLLWLGLIAGLIIGWLIEWMIDWRFWRRDLYRSWTSERELREELERARQEIGALQAQLAQLSWPAAEATDAIVQRDPLERIQGIDPIFAQRLHEAGIFTFSQLSASSPEQIIEYIQPAAIAPGDAEAWIVEARVFSQQPIQTISANTE
jgi:predicted flap endonuclease-1-like 5' DNA nuclease